MSGSVDMDGGNDMDQSCVLHSSTNHRGTLLIQRDIMFPSTCTPGHTSKSWARRGKRRFNGFLPEMTQSFPIAGCLVLVVHDPSG